MGDLCTSPYLLRKSRLAKIPWPSDLTIILDMHRFPIYVNIFSSPLFTLGRYIALLILSVSRALESLFLKSLAQSPSPDFSIYLYSIFYHNGQEEERSSITKRLPSLRKVDITGAAAVLSLFPPREMGSLRRTISPPQTYWDLLFLLPFPTRLSARICSQSHHYSSP